MSATGMRSKQYLSYSPGIRYGLQPKRYPGTKSAKIPYRQKQLIGKIRDAESNPAGVGGNRLSVNVCSNIVLYCYFLRVRDGMVLV